MVKTATAVLSALLLCVGGALAQDFMSPNVNIMEELGKLKNMEERLRTMEGMMQNQRVLVEQLQKENGALKTTVETMQATLESLQSFKAALCGDYPAVENANVTEVLGGLILKVSCAALYKLVGPEEVMCVKGKWSDLPACKAPCRLDQSKFRSPQREYMQHGEISTFMCSSSFLRVHIKCEDGRAYYKGCGNHDW
ncbi:complement factor H-related protein 2-like [Pygocentrus nattereri]|uniref:complement factor H-related protein 2-like n=1 Tax=Pygocentrus nattereri TaxID=42514 RepID=UPI0008145A26|nr:complement factor H-related protein 2-like [Pygocentrus nattereri]